MALKVTYQGVDAQGRRFTDLVCEGAAGDLPTAEADVLAALGKVPFTGARQVLVTPATRHAKVNIDKAGNPRVLSFNTTATLLTTVAQTEGQGVRIVGP